MSPRGEHLTAMVLVRLQDYLKRRPKPRAPHRLHRDERLGLKAARANLLRKGHLYCGFPSLGNQASAFAPAQPHKD